MACTSCIASHDRKGAFMAVSKAKGIIIAGLYDDDEGQNASNAQKAAFTFHKHLYAIMQAHCRVYLYPQASQYPFQHSFQKSIHGHMTWYN